jgi:hypothetical protein
LYGIDGELMLADDDGAGGTDAGIIEYEVPATGTYRVLARGYSAEEGGQYELSLTLVELEIQGTLVPGQAVEAELEVGMRHHWLFEGAAGDVVTISMRAIDGEWDTFLELIGPNSELVTEDDDSGGESDAAILDFELPLDGTYRIVARGFSQLHSGAYELTLIGP